MERLLPSFLRPTLVLLVSSMLLATGVVHAQQTVSGAVWHDLDGDGISSDLDIPMAGVVVRLFSDPDGDGDPVDGELVQATATDVAGEFYFEEVVDGNYVLEQVDPPGATSTFDSDGDPTDSRISVEVVGDDVGDLTFLDTGVSLAAIRGSVLLEGPANDGDFGADDEPIGAVIVRLYADMDGDGLVGADDALIETTATRLDGRYGVGGLVSGMYVVQLENPAGAVNLNDAHGAADDGVVAVTLAFANETDASFLVSGVAVAALRGQIRLDLDGDGDPLDVDPPLAGVIMLLFTDPDGDGNFFDGFAVQVGVTDLNGNYSFPQLPPGSYVIFKFDPPGGSATYDPSDSATDNLIAANLAGVDATNLDYLIEGASVGTAQGSVFEDGPDQDGEFSGDDIGITGVTVRLWADVDADGIITDNDALLGDVISSTGGSVRFPNLTYGFYLSEVVAPSGSDPINDLGGSLTDGQIAFELSGSQFEDLLFLFDGIDHADLVGETRNDLNGDGNPADPDPALPNVTIHLWTDPDGNGDPEDGRVIATTVTNGQGSYQFAAVAPGSYVLEAVAPLGATTTFDAEGAPNDALMAVTLSGTHQTERDILFTGAQLATLSGAVFNDGPDLPDAFSLDDVPLQAVFMQLYADINDNGVADFGDVLIMTRVTDRFGAYEFTGLPDGEYLIVKVNPPGTSNVLDVQGSPIDSTVAIELAGLDQSGQDFLVSGAIFMSIFGQTRDDADVDGDLSDTDEGLPGVVVRLYVDLYSDGQLTDEDPLIDSVVAAAAGAFEFPGLIGGSYLLQADAPRGAAATGDSDGANDSLVRVQLTNGDDADSVFLFDFNPTGFLYDAISGEIVVGGAVQVTGPGDITVWYDGSSGQYAFVTDGTPGTYTLAVTPPAGYVQAPTREAQPGSLDVTALVADPTSVGAGRDPTAPAYLLDRTAPANPFYLAFEMSEDDSLVIHNNFPLVRVDAPSFAYWSQIKPGAGGQPTSNLDGDTRSDLIEYAFDTDPASGVATEPRHGVVFNSVSQQFDAFYTVREQGHGDVTVKLKLLDDLGLSPGGWVDADGAGVSTSNGDGSRTVVFANLESQPAFVGNSAGFVRFEVALDADLDGNPDVIDVTEAEGWEQRTLPQQIRSWSTPLAELPLLEGRISGVSGSVLDLSQALNGTDIATLFNGTDAYYVEVVEGDHAGQRLEVSVGASGGSSLQVDPASPRSTLTSVPATLQDNQMVLRRHLTLGRSFPPSQMKATANPVSADRVMLYNPSKPGFDTYWVLAQNGGKWVLDGDLSFSDQGGLVISPQSGLMVQRRDPTLTLPATGQIRSNPFTFRLTQGQNLLGTPWPIAQGALAREMTTAAGFTGTNQPTASDMISVLRADSEPTTGGYDAYFLLKSGASELWVLQGDTTFQDRGSELLFRVGRASFVKSILGKEDHTVIAPWVP